MAPEMDTNVPRILTLLLDVFKSNVSILYGDNQKRKSSASAKQLYIQLEFDKKRAEPEDNSKQESESWNQVAHSRSKSGLGRPAEDEGRREKNDRGKGIRVDYKDEMAHSFGHGCFAQRDISIITDDRYGITYLNSKDVAFLLSLACAERLEDLDRVTTAVARLGRKCSDSGLNRFNIVYTNLKLGTIDMGKLEYGSKEMQKRIDKMERLISATSNLYTSLESLTEMEMSEIKLKQWKKNMVSIQGPLTVGGSGLALRYANVILLAEQYFNLTVVIGNDASQNLYHMLLENLKASVRTKLKKKVRVMEDDESLAAGWREALTEMMGWLAPMAHDTLKWQMERIFQRKKFDLKPSVLLLQTLHFADKEKTEAAIARMRSLLVEI
ncbi:hypothetical protein RJ640_005267 [Escallonia rubra]|uniref:DUF668 domain-containing protein n=1 Tax=Escallonia rubra TaxID=112253 RepID=A0AA88UUQ3_9ASTE|nr:hypothetical protein RJ640_005267 [Escallonia rubra]